jgi:hypothetical protein
VEDLQEPKNLVALIADISIGAATTAGTVTVEVGASATGMTVPVRAKGSGVEISAVGGQSDNRR